MGLSGKKVIQVDVKSNGDVLFGLFRYKLNELLNIAPEYFKSCDLQEGQWGTLGSIINWNFVLDGKQLVVKHNIESLDVENKSITFKLLDGDLMKMFKSLKANLQINGNYDNSTVTWTLEYEKINELIPEPDSLFEAVQKTTQYLETRLNLDSLTDIKIPQLQ